MRSLAVAPFLALLACSPTMSGDQPDAATADAVPTNVRVTVHPGLPGIDAQRYPVQFIEAEGTLATATTTDTLGHASGVIHAGASVTVFEGSSSGPIRIKTVLGLQPGDDLTIDAPPSPSPDTAPLTVTFPAYAGASRYFVIDDCGGGTDSASPPSATITMSTACDAEPGHVIVEAYDGATLLAYLLKADVLHAGGTEDAGTSWAPAATFAAHYTNAPSDATHVSVARWTTFETPAEGDMDPANGGADFALPVEIGAAASVSTEVLDQEGGRRYLADPLAGDAMSYAVDLSTALLPAIHAPSFDPAARTFHVPLAGAATYDLFEAEVGLTRGGQAWQWIVVGPQAGDVTLPPLANELALYNAQAGDAASMWHARIIDLDDAAGYDAVRADYGAAIDRADDVTWGHDVAHRARASRNGIQF